MHIYQRRRQPAFKLAVYANNDPAKRWTVVYRAIGRVWVTDRKKRSSECTNVFANLFTPTQGHCQVPAGSEMNVLHTGLYC